MFSSTYFLALTLEFRAIIITFCLWGSLLRIAKNQQHLNSLLSVCILLSGWDEVLMLLGCLKSLLCKACFRVLHYYYYYYYYYLLDPCMNLCQFIVAVEGVKNDKGFYNLSKVPIKSNQLNPPPPSTFLQQNVFTSLWTAPTKAKCNNYVNARTEEK